MSLRETVIKYRVEGAQKADRQVNSVRASVVDTARTAKQETGTIERWMTANTRALEKIGLAAAGALTGILALSPTFRAELSGVRLAFTLFADTIVRDVLPASGTFTELAFDMVQSFQDLDDSTRTWIGALIVGLGIFGIFLKVGGLLLGVLGPLIPSAFTLGKAFGAVVIAGKILVGVIAALTAPLWLVVGVIGVLIGVGVLLLGHFMGWWDIRDIVGGVFDWVEARLSDAWEWVKKTGAGLRDDVTEIFNDMRDRVTERVGQAPQWGKDLASNLASGVRERAGRVRTRINEIRQTITDRITSAVSNAMDWGRNIVENIASGIRDRIDRVRSAAR